MKRNVGIITLNKDDIITLKEYFKDANYLGSVVDYGVILNEIEILESYDSLELSKIDDDSPAIFKYLKAFYLYEDEFSNLFSYIVKTTKWLKSSKKSDVDIDSFLIKIESIEDLLKGCDKVFTSYELVTSDTLFAFDKFYEFEELKQFLLEIKKHFERKIEVEKQRADFEKEKN